MYACIMSLIKLSMKSKSHPNIKQSSDIENLLLLSSLHGLMFVHANIPSVDSCFSGSVQLSILKLIKHPINSDGRYNSYD
jgi:hypothetical protein